MGRHPISVAVNLTPIRDGFAVEISGTCRWRISILVSYLFFFFVTKDGILFLFFYIIVTLFYRYLLGERKVILTSKMGIINLCTLTYEVRIPLRRPSSLVIFGKMTCSFCCLFLSEGTIMALHVQYLPEYPLGQHMPTILSWGMGSSHSKSSIPSETRNVLFRCLGS